MHYSDSVIEEVRSRNDIVEVIGQYVTLRKKGANYFGLCPFHNERSPSFAVSPARQSYHCFGCGEGGSVFGFLMKYENLSYPEAIKSLAQRAGISLPEEDDSPQAKRERDRRETLLAINKEAATYYYYQLRSETGARGLAYFRERGLSDETMKRFGLGYARMEGGLCTHLRQKGYSDAMLIEAGVAVHDERTGLRDKFWNRVIFPIQDARSRVIGFGGRVMGDGKPKYLNSPETPVFDKSNNLFGLNLAKNARAGFFILCEGYMDVIALHQAGFSMAVASLGTSLTVGHAGLIRRYTDRVVLSYDSDEAGVKAAHRGIEILGRAGIGVKVLNLRPYKDPDEFIKGEGAQALEARIEEAENPILYTIRIRSERTDMADPEERAEFFRYAARVLSEIRVKLERDGYVRTVADRYSVSVRDLEDMIISVAAENGIVHQAMRPRDGRHSAQPKEDPARMPQRVLLTWLCEDPALFGVASKWVEPGDFEEGIYSDIATTVWRQLKEDGRVNTAAIIDSYSDEQRSQEASAILNERLPDTDAAGGRGRAVREVLCRIRERGNEESAAKYPADDPGYFARLKENMARLEALRSAELNWQSMKTGGEGNGAGEQKHQ